MSSNNFIQCIHSWNKEGSIISNYDISLLRPLSCKKKSKFERMRGCICSFIIENGSFIKWEAETGIVNQLNTFQNICQILFIYAIHGCKCSSEKYHVHWGMDDRSNFHDKETLYPEKSCSLRLNAVTDEEKLFFKEQLPWITAFFYELLFH